MNSNASRVATRRAAITLAAAVAAGLGGAARAETPPAVSGGIEEIVVTAQKRAESLQSVPVSVTALTATQLGELKMDTPSDLVTQIPNLQVNGIVGEGSPLFSLRGVSMFDYSLNQSSPVASYIDEVYKGNFVLFGVEMYDLERIEVLRGPQGTLYGKNTTGGAINFITRKPGFETEGNIKVGIGNYNRREGQAALQGTLVPDKVAVRFAFSYTKADGWMKNVLPGSPDLEGTNQWGARLSLLYRASDSLDFTLRYSKSRQDPQNYAILDGRVNPALGIGLFGGYFRTADGTPSGKPLADDEVAQNYTPKRRQDNQALALTANWKLSDGYSVTSITSWDQGRLFNPEGTDGAPLDIWKIPYFGKTKQVTQDLRLTTTGSGPLNFIVGAYYQHETIFNTNENRIFNFLDYTGDNKLNAQDCETASFNPDLVNFPGTGYVNGVFINLTCNYYNQFDQIRNSWAVYSDGSYSFSDAWKLRVGLRYNHDNGIMKNALDQLRGSDGTPIANILVGLNNGVPVDALGLPNYSQLVNATASHDLHNTAVTGRLGVDFAPAKDTLLYANYSRGYRSAAFNAQFLFTPDDFTIVKPETVDSFELGFKTAWLGNRVQLNGAAFHYQYKNQQIINVFPTGQQPLINLGKSKIDGGELELVARPVRDLTLHASLGILNTKVQEGVLASGSIAGDELPYAPTVSGTVAIDWDAVRWSSGSIALHLDTSFNGKQYLALPNRDPVNQFAYSQQDSYALVNARLSLRTADDKWEVGAWGRNIGDKFYLTNIVNVQGFGFDYRHRGTPRMFGLDASYRF